MCLGMAIRRQKGWREKIQRHIGNVNIQFGPKLTQKISKDLETVLEMKI